MIQYRVEAKIKPFIQPFERTLAEMELSALASNHPIKSNGSGEVTYSVWTDTTIELLADRLTYWESIGDGNGQIAPRQIFREATAGTRPRNHAGDSPHGGIGLPRRRILRYGPHGIHEYRGKFFPQLVRSLLNYAECGRDALILDPMCGSGTTLVEACLLGCQGVGLDLNPLSHLISKSKSDILQLTHRRLANAHSRLQATLGKKIDGQLRWFSGLSEVDQTYLRRWFSGPVLSQLDAISCAIGDIADRKIRDFFRVSLSSILRRVSYQKDDDLRVRKDQEKEIPEDIIQFYLQQTKRTVDALAPFLKEISEVSLGSAIVRQGDARLESAVQNVIAEGSAEAVVTSPPYATALPYLDTDRLSLTYLGLLPRNKQRKLDLEMIGNREVTSGHRKAYRTLLSTESARLPDTIPKLIEKIEGLNSGTDVGFRRQNLPALLCKYFVDMRRVLSTIRWALRPGAPAFVVVGNNHTIAGGERVEIETDLLLAELGQAVGLKFERDISMEMLTSRDIFRNNTGSAETILIFRKP